MRLFYDEHIPADAKQHKLSEEESKHIVRVLRMQSGDALKIIDGKGRAFECTISDPHPKRCLVDVNDIHFQEAPNWDIHIAVGPTKQMERIEWFVEKATEIGITEITLIEGKNGERAKINLDRLQKKAISAMKQSQRLYLPQINALVSVDQFIAQHPNGLIAHCYAGEKERISGAFQLKNCPILIGPEGDFTLEEVQNALENGYKTITLGENRLRTETAALYACMQAKLRTEL